MADVSYSPYDYDAHDDPYPTYVRLRDEAPLYRNDDLGFWALSRHADVAWAFRDSTRLSSGEGVTLDPSGSGPNAWRSQSFLAMDPPRHGRMRGLVSRGFTPRRVQELEPRIRELARGHLEAALARGPSLDFVADFAARLPMDVISELIGVDPADRDEVRRLADLVVHREPGIDDVPPAGIDAAFQLVGYYADLLDARRRRPSDDLVSALVAIEVDGDRLTDDELLGFLFLLVVAGNETTTKLLGNAWWWGSRFPEEGSRPFADPALVGPWVEETLRFDTSTQALARTAAVDIEVHDGTIPAGDRVLLLIGSANRDPRAFADPDRYDLSRRHGDLPLLSFGVGRHFCLGASLARLEARVALEEVVAAIDGYEIDEAGAVRVHSANVRGFASLPSTVTRRRRTPA